MRIRVAVQNLKQGGQGDGDGRAEDRWPQLAARLAAITPDIVLLNLSDLA